MLGNSLSSKVSHPPEPRLPLGEGLKYPALLPEVISPFITKKNTRSGSNPKHKLFLSCPLTCQAGSSIPRMFTHYFLDIRSSERSSPLSRRRWIRGKLEPVIRVVLVSSRNVRCGTQACSGFHLARAEAELEPGRASLRKGPCG